MAFEQQTPSLTAEKTALLGCAVQRFMQQHGLKSETVRMASHFGTSKFAQLKKAN